MDGAYKNRVKKNGQDRLYQDHRGEWRESVCVHLENCTQITIGEIARLQRDGGENFASIHDSDQFDKYSCVAAFRIERITDGRGRYWKCDGKLTIHDRAFGKTDYPLEWRQSNLGNGGFWVIVDGTGHHARKLYRTPYGWRTYREYREVRGNYDWRNGDRYHGHALYEKQKENRERREGRGRFGGLLFAIKYEDFAGEVCGDKYRKWTYRGKPTPYGKRMRKRFAKLKPAWLQRIRQIPNLTTVEEMDAIKYILERY